MDTHLYEFGKYYTHTKTPFFNYQSLDLLCILKLVPHPQYFWSVLVKQKTVPSQLTPLSVIPFIYIDIAMRMPDSIIEYSPTTTLDVHFNAS